LPKVKEKTVVSNPPGEPAVAGSVNAGETRVVLDNVSWETFERLLDETGPRRGRFAYEGGTLEIMSPSREHEILKSNLGRLVEAYALELGIDMQVTGSTTLKLEMKQRGAEPDESYYIQNERVIRGRTDLVLGRDPPPDLAIEIQLTRSALDKLGIYAVMGVPEVWLWEGDALKVYWLSEQGGYVEHGESRALPRLPLPDLLRFLAQGREKSTTRLMNDFRAWVRENPAR
jgi:Uma2 family endonuclease